MPDPGLRVRAAADRIITHHVLDDLTELERHTEPVRDGIAMRLDRPLPTLTSDRKPTIPIVPDGPSPDRAILTGALHHLGHKPDDLSRMNHRVNGQRLGEEPVSHGLSRCAVVASGGPSHHSAATV
jgi:hypothetical protein